MKKVFYFLGLLIAQIIIIGLTVRIILFLAISAPTLSAQFQSPIFYLIVILLISLIGLFVPIASAIWTYRDAKKLKDIRIINPGMPFAYASIVFAAWFPGFAIYLFLRKFRYKTRLQT